MRAQSRYTAILSTSIVFTMAMHKLTQVSPFHGRPDILFRILLVQCNIVINRIIENKDILLNQRYRLEQGV